MPTIYIDGIAHEVHCTSNLLEACIELRKNLPYFCWHPALGSAGACRLCAVKQFQNEKDTQGRIVMSCMTPVVDGIRISIEDPAAREVREGVIEATMTNHPHDCPVCDEGGECHLQDMTMMTGHSCREYRFEKRTFKNQNLGPFLNHEMNRCIQCYRCVRFYKDYAGGEDLQAFSSRNRVCFGRSEDGPLENEFSGNLVPICPTGVFTDKSQREHYTRRWDLQMAPSVCVHCGVGCNITPGERYGTLRRIRNRYNGQVNGFFLCDRGRFGYEFVNADTRVRNVMLRSTHDAPQEPATKEAALQAVKHWIENAPKVIAVGSPRASLETNFVLRELVVDQNFCMGALAQERHLTHACLSILEEAPFCTPSLREIGEAEAVLILGEDLINTAPMMGLQVRQAVRNVPIKAAVKAGIPEWNDIAIREAVQEDRGPFYSFTVEATKLDGIATRASHMAPQDIARMGYAIAHALDPAAPAVEGLSEAEATLAGEIANALLAVDKCVVISGPSLCDEEIIKAAANVVHALHAAKKSATLAYTCAESNSFGVGMIDGMSLEDALAKVEATPGTVVIVAENDLARRVPEPRMEEFFKNVGRLIVLAHTKSIMSENADCVLPAAAFAEGDGTLVNSEGRAQRFYQVFMPEGDIQESWRWVDEIERAVDLDEERKPRTLDHIINAMADAIPCLDEIRNLAPDASYRVGGQKIPRQSQRYSGRTAMRANKNVSEGGIQSDPESSYGFTMEGFLRRTPAALMSSFWAPGWNSPQAVTRFQEEVDGKLEGGDPGIRMIAPKAGAQAHYSICTIKPYAVRTGEFLLLPLYHIFGSEELSSLSPPVAERCTDPYVALNAQDAQALGFAEGEEVMLMQQDKILHLPLRVSSSLPKGAAGFPVGLRGVPAQVFPCFVTLRRAEA